MRDAQDDTDDENPPDETVRATPRVLRHRCPLVHNCSVALGESRLTHRGTSGVISGVEGQGAPETSTVSPLRAFEASSTLVEPVRVAPTLLRVSETTPARLGVSGATRTPPVSVAPSTTQETSSGVAHKRWYTTPTTSPSVYVSSPITCAPAYVPSQTRNAPTAFITALTSSPEDAGEPALDICRTSNQADASPPSRGINAKMASLTRRSPHSLSQAPAPGTPAEAHGCSLSCSPPAQIAALHDCSKYSYITSREFLLRVHDLALVMASQSVPVTHLRELPSVFSGPSCRGKRRSWTTLGRIGSSPESQQISPVLRQYCKSFIVAMLCPKQAPSEAVMLAPLVDRMEGRAYADDPNFKMNYCWQLATALCLILEELGRIDRAR